MTAIRIIVWFAIPFLIGLPAHELLPSQSWFALGMAAGVLMAIADNLLSRFKIERNDPRTRKQIREQRP